MGEEGGGHVLPHITIHIERHLLAGGPQRPGIPVQLGQRAFRIGGETALPEGSTSAATGQIPPIPRGYQGPGKVARLDFVEPW